MRRIIWFLLFTGIATSVMAQSYGAIVTDRPDQTESALTVPKNRFQIETGFILERNESDNAGLKKEIQNLSLATTLLRYGLTKKIELRLSTQFTSQRIKEVNVDNTNSGINGVHIGAKANLLKSSGISPAIALLLGADLPVGADKLVSNNIEPKVLLAAAHQLNKRLGFGYNLGSVLLSGGKFSFIYSAAIGLSMSRGLGAFVEVYGDKEEEQKTNVLIDYGLTILLRRNLQLDISAGQGLNEDAPDWFANAGLSIRIPK